VGITIESYGKVEISKRKEKEKENNNKKRSKNNKSLKLCLGDLIIIRNGAKTISLQTLFGRLNNDRHKI
jgi:hypothetical protein